jgi:hypothetical protein
VFVGIYKVSKDVIFHDLRHEAGGSTAHPSQQMHYLLAAGLGLNGTLNRSNLAAYAAYTC